MRNRIAARKGGDPCESVHSYIRHPSLPGAGYVYDGHNETK